jgi:pimeloyl-ACP methyl ester carboxylesterase
VSAAQILPLADGREFAYYEYGDPAGVPVVYITGTPASGLAGALYDDAARAHRVRVISVDKPGYGRSSFDPARSLRRHADDIAALADHLGLDRFAVIGESGGGPHALAVGRYLPERLTMAIVLAGLGPATERWVVEGMRKDNRRLLTLAQRAPWVLSIPIALMARQMSTPERVAKAALRQQKKSPEADRRYWREHPERAAFMYAATADAFRQGSRAARQELVLLARPWGFGLDEVKAPTHVWHGTEDVNVPIATATRVCEQLPDCTSHIVPGKGHAVSMYETDAIMATVAAAAKS